MKKRASGMTQILVVEDHPMMRRAMRLTFEDEPDLTVSGEADCAASALTALAKGKVDLAVVDISLKDSNGIDLTKDIRRKYPNLPIVVVSMHEDAQYVRGALAAGANGYVSKHEEPETIVEAIRSVLQGEVFVDRRLGSKLVAESAREKPVLRPELPSLTAREAEVLKLAGNGLSVQEMSDRMKLSTKTVHKHRRSLMAKVKVKNVADLVRYSIRSGSVKA